MHPSLIKTNYDNCAICKILKMALNESRNTIMLQQALIKKLMKERELKPEKYFLN